MARFKAMKSLGGNLTHQILPIATATAIELGEIVLATPGTGIAVVAGTELDDPAIGVSLQEHDGASTNETGTELKVMTGPNTVLGLRSTEAQTLTGGSTATVVISGLLPQTDNLWIGGYVEVVTCATGIVAGTMIKITDSTGSTGSLAIDTQSSAFDAGDTVILHPGKLAIGEYGWDLNGDGTDIDYTSSAGEGLTLYDADPENKMAYFMLRLHQFGNDAVAK